MLMSRGVGDDGDRAWRCMSCVDPCDFQSLSKKAFGFFDQDDNVLWHPGDVVALWDADESAMTPVAHGRFQRFATVIAAEAAGDDKAKVLKQWPDGRTRAGIC